MLIAAGLSIQDPANVPDDAAAHERFLDPQSDFLTLLKIWDAVHDQWEKLRTQNQRRKFCQANLCRRRGLHAQLHAPLAELGCFKLNESNADYAAIHRSVCTGLLAHIATRARRRTSISGRRQPSAHPVSRSALFDRNENYCCTSRPRKNTTHPNPFSATCLDRRGEIVETSQFVRTVAGIDRLWIVQLAPHGSCQVTDQNPHWSVTAGNVLVEERTTFYGMEIRKVKVADGNAAAGDGNFHPSRSSRRILSPGPTPADDENDADDVRVLTSAGRQQPLPPQMRF